MKRRKVKADRKEKSILVRVTDEQKAILATVAQKEGLGASAWLRRLGLQEASKLLDIGRKHKD